MRANDESPGKSADQIQTAPASGSLCWVRCADYHCLAFMDNTGKWFAVATGKEVTGVVEVYPG